MAIGPIAPLSGEANDQRESAGASAPQPAYPRRSPWGAFDALYAMLICGLAFLLASIPARNSDLWLHLASGRFLSGGKFPNGTDPFSSATAGVFWVNHTWLSDLFLYWVYHLGGGTALVVGKAVLTAVLAALLLSFRPRGEGLGILPLAGFAAMLALAPWLLLQPILWSLLGVTLTLFLLERPGFLEGASAERARAGRWLLVPLFALWANLDGWFLLGPVLVGLYALGELPSALRPTKTTTWADSGVLLTLAGLAACLATPYHYRIFDWPTPLGLTPTEHALRHDPIGQTLVLSPLGGRFAASPVFRSPGTWAYFFLLTAGAASFVLSRPRLHPGRLLTWMALAALSIYQARTIPFFVVVAAPVLALNVREWSHSRPYSEILYRLRSAAQKVGVLVGLLLLVLAWPGWLQPAPYQPRSWSVEPDGSLVRLAGQVNRWREDSRLRPDRFALTFSPEVAHYLAWFCPDEKGFVDSRWSLFDRVADDYTSMRRCLLQESGGGPELASLLDAHGIDRILLHDPDWERMARAYRHLFLAASEWELLVLEGGATLFRRRSEASPSTEAFDFGRAVYHPAPDRQAPPAPPPPRPPGLFDAFWRSDNDRFGDRAEAALYLLSFDIQTERLAASWLLVQTTGMIGCGTGRDPAAATVAMAVRLGLPPPLFPSPTEAPVLAARAARRALAVNPDDGRAFLLLGEAYFRLTRQTREANWQTMLPALSDLRRVQLLTSLEQAVLLRPDLDRALLTYYERTNNTAKADEERRQLVELGTTP